MAQYILKRVLVGVLTLWVLLTVTFTLMHTIPGNPFQQREENRTPPEVLERINERYGLNRPAWQQYLTYLGDFVQGDFGISFKHANVSVNEIIARGFPVSARIGILAVALSLLLGVSLGVLSAIRRGRWMDWASMLFATVGISLPAFVISVLMMYAFAYKLKWLPSFGISTWQHYVLPVVCLSFSPTAYIARLTRSSMLEVLRADYIRTARAKGLSERMVILRHALRNAILPVITYVGPLLAALVTGSFVVERLFAIPGIGMEYVDSIGARDYSLIMGVTVFFGLLVIICNLVVDILYGIIDPRVRIDE